MCRLATPQPRQVALAAAAATAVLVGHLLDARGLLPGVHESAAVRRAALAPSLFVITVVGAALLALMADRLLRNCRPGLSLLSLVAGQIGLLGLPELLAREESGEGEQWGALAVAVAVQVLLATATIAAVLLVEALLLRALQPQPSLALAVLRSIVNAPAPSHHGRTPLSVRTRGPPVQVTH